MKLQENFVPWRIEMQPVEPAVMVKLVMPGLVAGIHVLTNAAAKQTWMAGTSPAMTKEYFSSC